MSSIFNLFAHFLSKNRCYLQQLLRCELLTDDVVFNDIAGELDAAIETV